MVVLRPQHGNLRLVFRLFESHPRQRTSLRFPCLGLNPIIDSFNHREIGSSPDPRLRRMRFKNGNSIIFLQFATDIYYENDH